MLDGAGEHVGDRLDAAVRVPRETGEVVRRPVVAEVVEEQERVGLGGVAEAEGAAQVDAGALDRRSGAAQSFDGANRHVGLLGKPKAVGPRPGKRPRATACSRRRRVHLAPDGACYPWPQKQVGGAMSAKRTGHRLAVVLVAVASLAPLASAQEINVLALGAGAHADRRAAELRRLARGTPARRRRLERICVSERAHRRQRLRLRAPRPRHDLGVRVRHREHRRRPARRQGRDGGGLRNVEGHGVHVGAQGEPGRPPGRPAVPGSGQGRGVVGAAHASQQPRRREVVRADGVPRLRLAAAAARGAATCRAPSTPTTATFTCASRAPRWPVATSRRKVSSPARSRGA